MKKILVVLALFGFGMMVGCGEEAKPVKKDSSKPAAGATDTAKAAPADTAKK